MKLTSLSVFFPAYNEQDNIVHTVEQALKIVPKFADQFEVIVVNDGSTDATARLLESMAKKYDMLRVITHQKNKGYGGALKSGFSAARYEYVFFTDGDGQFELSEIEKLISLIRDADIATGIRVNRRDPLYRRFNAKAYNAFVRMMFGLKVTDIDCAFKLIKKDVLRAVDLKSDSQFISAEFLIKAKKRGFSVRQCPVTHLPRYKGKQTGNSLEAIVNSFRELFGLWKELKK